MKKLLLSSILVLTSAIAAMAGIGVTANSTTICVGSCGTITAAATGGTGPYTFIWSPGGETAISINVCPTASTTYTVIVTDGVGATAAATAEVTVNPKLIPIITGNTTICSGNSVTLTAFGGDSYVWSTGENASNITVSPTSTTSYSVTATSGGCSGSASVQVTVTQIPIITITGNTTVCSGSSTALTATGGGTYSWSTGATTTTIIVYPPLTTTYKVTTVNGGCTGSATAQVTVNPKPAPPITGTTNICEGSATILTVFGGGSYVWSTGENASSITVSPTSTTSYTVTATSGGCSGSASVQVTVIQIPIITITGNTTVCPGSSTTLTASGGTSYLWSTTEITSAINVNPTVTTTYTVSSVSGCGGSATFAVTVLPASLTGVAVTDSVYKTSCSGTADGAIDITLSGSNPGPFTYQWSNGETTQDITNLSSDYYSLTIFDTGMNCWGNIYQVLSDGTNCGTLSGNIFDDTNGDCIKNVGDDSLSNIAVVANPGNRIAYTNTQGYYTFNNIPYGTYTLIQQISSPYIFATCATSLNATLNAGNKNITNLNFADTTASIPRDVSISAYSRGIVPGFVSSVVFYIYNLTIVPASGTLCVVLPAGYGALITSGTIGYSVNADTVCWSYANLTGYINYYEIFFTVPVNTPLGSPFTACASATVIGTDINLANNAYCYTRNVSGSFDPNDKSVNPIGKGPTGDIKLSDKTLSYHINFQNTGNGPAVNIVVKDSLSDKLDISTLEVTGASHKYILDVIEGNVLRWKFNNIMLADSGSNQASSHGWIDYRIKQKSSNQIGDQIKNTAYIYFDFNAAVVTNTTLNTIANFVGVEELTSSTNAVIKVYPNPFSDNTTFVIQSDKLNETYSFELIDVLGKQVKSINEITTKEFQVSRTDLPNGVYFYKINSAKSIVGIGKLVIK